MDYIGDLPYKTEVVVEDLVQASGQMETVGNLS